MITLRQLSIFVAIAQTGSTTAAAESVSLSQSAVSSALHELETTLQTRLFDRAGNRLVLNDDGKALLPYARVVIDSASLITREFSGVSTKAAWQLTIASSATIGHYIMPSVVSGFRSLDSAARAAVRVRDTPEVIKAVREFEVDVGFIEAPTIEPDLTVIPWIGDELVVVCSKDHPIAGMHSGTPASIDVLREQEWLLRERDSGTRELVEQMLLPHLHFLKEGAVFGSAEALKRGVALGLGLSCLSNWAIQDQLATQKLVVLNTVIPAFQRRFFIVHHKKKYLSSRLRRFLDYCTEARLTPE